MVLTVSIDGASISIQINRPHQPDIEAILLQIKRFAASKGTDIAGMDVEGLILRMIRGIAGCERGCPANAKGLVYSGYKGFDVQYIEGGILKASTKTPSGSILYLTMFPDF